MKKQFLNLGKALNKAEQMLVFGGNPGLDPGNCGYNNAQGEICGLSKEVAMEQVALFGGNWCCDSCASNGGSASYC